MTCKHKLETSIKLMHRGWTTALQSALAGGVLSLSQRVGELEREGVSVLRKWVDTQGGARVMAYRIPRGPTRWTA
jgi:hypothetical protein